MKHNYVIGLLREQADALTISVDEKKIDLDRCRDQLADLLDSIACLEDDNE